MTISLADSEGQSLGVRFALVTTDGDALGPVAFARSDFKPGDVIPQGPGRSLRVTAEPDREDELLPLVVELAN